MPKLLIHSLEIENYRCFQHLEIETFGRVNLIVGKNSVGKTALLEALWIYSQGSSWFRLLKTLTQLLEKRNEKEIPSGNSQTLKLDENAGLHFRHLFYGRPNNYTESRITANKALIHLNGENSTEIELHFVNETALLTSPHIQSGSRQARGNFHEEIRNLFVSSEGLGSEFLTQIWDDAILKNEEDDAVEALKIISSNVVDLNFINYPKESKSRVPVIRVKGINERVPLNSLGEGMTRLLGIALALNNNKGGVLFIDEIENGLHYTVLPDVWKLIFQTAQNLNVQVFATTHSRDCVEAFAAASSDSPEDGILIRLEKQGKEIIAKSIVEEMLVDAINYEVEVR